MNTVSAVNIPADKLEPQDLDSEQAILGSCFATGSVDRVADLIRPEEFFRSAYGEIFAAMLDCDQKGQAIELLTVQNALLSRGTFEDCGGLPVLSGLMLNHGAVVPSNSPYFAGRVRDKAQRRALIRAASEITTIAIDDEAEQEDVINRAERALSSAVDRESVEETCMDGQVLADVVLAQIEEDVKRGGRNRGMYTGLPDLDFTLGGLLPGELIIVAARTSMGKTALALTIMRNILLIGKRVLYFSLEMPRDAIMKRLYAIEAEVPMNRLMNGTVSIDDLSKTREARRRMAGCKFLVDDRSGVTPEYVRRKVRREMARLSLSCVFVDHIHLMRTTQRFDKTVERWGEVSQQLKILARDFSVPVVALAQFSRGPEMRNDKTPQMSDLRESGRLEEDADKIVSIFRPNYYKRQDAADARAQDDDVRLHVVKNRNGAVGSVPIRFNESTGFFDTLTKGRPVPKTTEVVSQMSTADYEDPFADTPEDVARKAELDAMAGWNTK